VPNTLYGLKSTAIRDLVFPKESEELKHLNEASKYNMDQIEIFYEGKENAKQHTAWSGYFRGRPNFAAFESFLKKQVLSLGLLKMYTVFDLLYRSFHNISVVDSTFYQGLSLSDGQAIFDRMKLVDSKKPLEICEMAKAGIQLATDADSDLGKSLSGSTILEEFYANLVRQPTSYVTGPADIFKYLVENVYVSDKGEKNAKAPTSYNQGTRSVNVRDSPTNRTVTSAAATNVLVEKEKSDDEVIEHMNAYWMLLYCHLNIHVLCTIGSDEYTGWNAR